MKKFATGVFISILGLALAMALIEASYRIVMRKRQATTNQAWSDRPHYYYKPQQSRSCQDYFYAPKKEGVFRIAVLGDSFTFATSMQFDDAFPKKLERMLNLNQEKTVEVLNYGVPGYSTNHEAALMKRVIKEGADLILLQVTLNDPQLKPYTPTGITGDNVFGAFQPSTELQKVIAYWKSLGFILERLHNESTHQRYVKYYFSLFERPQEWKHFKKAVKQIASASRKSGVPVVTVLFPLFGLPLDNNYPFLPLHNKVKETMTQNKIATLDLFQSYKGLPLARLQVVPNEDFHPNEIGHRLAAEAIYNYLESEKLIPDATIIRDKYRLRYNNDCSKNLKIE